MADPTSGYAFPGLTHLHADIYPSISPSLTPSLHQPSKTVLITGAGRGIGRSIALQYAHAHASTLLLCARTPSELTDVSTAIHAINPQTTVHTYTVDVTSESAVQHLAEEISQTVGRLDVLVNNAGYSAPFDSLTSSDAGKWWSTFEVNIKGPFLFLHFFLPLLVRTAETYATSVHVVNMSSIGANMVMPTASAYQVSKHAVSRLTEFVNVEYGAKGLVGVSVHPGGVETKLSSGGGEVLKPFLIDTPDLCGGFVVWLTAEARTWLAGRYVSSTWDVDVLQGMKEDIVAGDKLKAKMVV